MAAVTSVSSERFDENYILRKFTFTGATGDTLQTGMVGVFWIQTQLGTVITAIAQSYVSANGVQLTFTAGGPITAESILVFGRAG